MLLRIIKTFEEFEKLAASWNGLLAESSADQIFQRWEWQYTWAKHYLGQDQLRIILAFEEGRLVGIAPFYNQFKHTAILRWRQLGFLGDGEVCSAYLDVIAAEKKKDSVLSAVVSFLFSEAKDDWDRLVLSELPAESASIDVLFREIDEPGKVMDISGHSCSPVIRLEGGVEALLNRIGRNERYNLRRKTKRLESSGAVEFHRMISPVEVEKEFSVFVGLHELRWKGKGRAGCFASSRFSQFHSEIAKLFSQEAWVRLDFLSVNGEKIAGIYGFTYRGTYSFYLPGFNPSVLPEVSPGILLLFESVRQASAEGCAEFDLLRGATTYKSAWASGCRRSLTLSLYNKTTMAAALKALEGIKSCVKVVLR
jgi:CelD/BcsL family acetyltransferase involved in cellulose biosynthesis